ncbi:MAG: DUF5018 domain-containing protein [Prevotellaceae bacterium]|jgi:hypothetical protein|nr:DUF5018 domain-containing protein [Prevotellaceae bacterium]
MKRINFQFSTFNFQRLLLLLAATLVVGCNRENDDPFAGTDSYITAFALRQGDAVFYAVIVDRVITITAPEDFPLTQAQAAVAISENATIYPDPATVTDWDEEQLFAVTARNGSQTRYKYTVERSGIAHSGSVVLETQADVDAFGARGISLIDGNLTIGRTAGTDSIRSLLPLAALREVVYAFTLQPTCALTGLEGLDNLERVGGPMQFGGTTTATSLKRLETLALPALKYAGAINLANTVTLTVELPELAGVSKQISLNVPLLQLQLTALQTVGGTFTLTTSDASITSLNQVALPALEEAGHIALSAFPKVTKIDLPRLQKAAGLSCTSMSSLSLIYAPLLEEITGSLTLSGVNALTEVNLPELTRAGGISTSNCRVLTVLELPKLLTANTIYLYETPVSGFSGFPSLQSAGTVTLLFIGTAGMERIKLPDAMEQLKKLDIEYRLSPPVEIDVRGVVVGELQAKANAVRAKFIGDEAFRGTLVIMPENTSRADTLTFPRLQGFSEIDSLYLPSAGMNKVYVHGIRKVNKGIYAWSGHASQTHEFGFPDLEEVGGTLDIEYYTMGAPSSVTVPVPTFTAVVFDKLRSVGGNFYLEVMRSTATAISCPELASIGGYLNLFTCYDYTSGSTVYRSIETLHFPKLTTIGGKLTLQSGSSSRNNAKLTTLDGFSALTGVKQIDITRQAALVSYYGLRHVNLDELDSWSATNNAYNPSLQDLKDGKWTQ